MSAEERGGGEVYAHEVMMTCIRGHSHWPQQLLLVTESILVLVEQAVVLLLAIMSYTILHNACTDIPASMHYASMYYATMYNNMYYV